MALCLIGAVMVFSASAVTAREQYGNGYYFLLRQLVWLAIGLGGMFALMHVDYRRLREPRFVFTSCSPCCAARRRIFSGQVARHAPLDPSGPGQLAAFGIRQARRDFLSGVVLGGAAPPAKFWREQCAGNLVPALGVCCCWGLVVIEPDLGTAVEIFMIALAMLFVAGLSENTLSARARRRCLPFILRSCASSYRYERVMAFLHPDADPQGHGFQLMQSLIAVGSGGFTGVGLMESKQKLFYLPEAHTDFIFAVLCEEMGFIGGALVLAIFAIYGWRGMRAAFTLRTISGASWRWASL